MPTHERVLAIVVNWNGREVLPATLDALRSTFFPPLETVVVDNGSTDGSTSSVQDPVRLVTLDENRGYAGALNAILRPALEGEKGAGEAPPDYFLLLNNDILVEPGTVSRLLELAREKGPGVYGPKVLLQDRPDRLDAAWGRITWSHVLSSFRGKGARDRGGSTGSGGCNCCWDARCWSTGGCSRTWGSSTSGSSCITRRWTSSSGRDGEGTRPTSVPRRGCITAAPTPRGTIRCSGCSGFGGTRCCSCGSIGWAPGRGGVGGRRWC